MRYGKRNQGKGERKQGNGFTQSFIKIQNLSQPEHFWLQSQSSSIKGPLLFKVVFHQRLSFTRGFLPSKVIFYQRCPTSMGIFHQRLSLIKSILPLRVMFHQRSSSIRGCLPLCQTCYRRFQNVPITTTILTKRRRDKQKHLQVHKLSLCQNIRARYQKLSEIMKSENFGNLRFYRTCFLKINFQDTMLTFLFSFIVMRFKDYVQQPFFTLSN